MINSKETLKRMIGGFVMSQDHINERIRRELENAQSGGFATGARSLYQGRNARRAVSLRVRRRLGGGRR